MGEASFQLDQTPPETTASLDGTPVTGINVFVEDVTLSLGATDEPSGLGFR